MTGEYYYASQNLGSHLPHSEFCGDLSITTFHDTFAGVVYHYGALLGLLIGVPADVDKCLDDVVEGVVVVVVDNKFASVVVKKFYVLLFVFLVFLVGSHGCVSFLVLVSLLHGRRCPLLFLQNPDVLWLWL